MSVRENAGSIKTDAYKCTASNADTVKIEYEKDGAYVFHFDEKDYHRNTYVCLTEEMCDALIEDMLELRKRVKEYKLSKLLTS